MKTNKGFTLVELMVTIAVVAILMTVALPAFMSVVQNNKAVTQANELVTAINLTRSEAIKRGSSVTICASNNSTSCIASYAATAWPSGWIVFSDTDGDKVVDAGETVIRVWDNIAAGTVLTNTDGTSGVAALRYKSTGLTDLGAELTFTMKVNDCMNDNGREIKISTTGRIHIGKVAC